MQKIFYRKFFDFENFSKEKFSKMPKTSSISGIEILRKIFKENFSQNFDARDT